MADMIAFAWVASIPLLIFLAVWTDRVLVPRSNAGRASLRIIVVGAGFAGMCYLGGYKLMIYNTPLLMWFQLFLLLYVWIWAGRVFAKRLSDRSVKN